MEARSHFLMDMSIIGDALLRVTDAYRINYAVMGNSDPKLHAHVVPRYLSEPDEYRLNQPWAYATDIVKGRQFDPDLDKTLINNLHSALRDLIQEEKDFSGRTWS